MIKRIRSISAACIINENKNYKHIKEIMKQGGELIGSSGVEMIGIFFSYY